MSDVADTNCARHQSLGGSNASATASELIANE
jgi:hypothetical protein